MARAVDEAANAHLVAAMDVNLDLACDLGKRYDAAYTDNVAELLARPDVEAVYIAVPHHLHAPLAIQAARADKHVLLEKPMATTVADARAIAAACEQAGVALSLDFMLRYHSAHRRARELVAAGAIGDVIGTHVVYRGDKPESYWHGGYTGRVRTDWRVSWEKAGGGVLIMNMVHFIDLVRYMTGLEADRVYAEYGTFLAPAEVEVEDFITVTLRYHNGALGSIEAGACLRGGMGPGRPPAMRIYGSHGQIMLPNPGRSDYLQIYLDRPWEALPSGEWQTLEMPSVAPRTLLVEDFVDAVQRNAPPPITASDGIAVQVVVEAAYQAGRSGQPVTLKTSTQGGN